MPHTRDHSLTPRGELLGPSDHSEIQVLDRALAHLRLVPEFRHNPTRLAIVERAIRAEQRRLHQRFRFEFDGQRSFATGSGCWTPHPKGLGHAVMVYLAVLCRGAEVFVAGPSYGAVHAAIDRQVEALARVDLRLANVLAFSPSDEPGLHLRSDTRHHGLFWLRWQAPR